MSIPNLEDTSFLGYFINIPESLMICSFLYCILKPHMILTTEQRTVVSSVKVNRSPNYTLVQLSTPLTTLTTFFCIYRSLKSVAQHHLHRWDVCLHAVAASVLGPRTHNSIQQVLQMARSGHSALGIVEGSQAMSESYSPNSLVSLHLVPTRILDLD